MLPISLFTLPFLILIEFRPWLLRKRKLLVLCGLSWSQIMGLQYATIFGQSLYISFLKAVFRADPVIIVKILVGQSFKTSLPKFIADPATIVRISLGQSSKDFPPKFPADPATIFDVC